MAKVTGIGGIFLRADDPEALGTWYRDVLGFDMNGPAWMQTAGPTIFAPFARDDSYFPEAQQAMLNFRVDDLDGLIARLKATGIAVETRAEWDGPVGRFARIVDPEGNAVELWEPGAAADG